MSFRPQRPGRGQRRARLLTSIAFLLLCTAFTGVWLFAVPPTGRPLTAALARPKDLDTQPMGAQAVEANQILITEAGFLPAVLTTTVDIPVVWINNTSVIYSLRSGAAQRVYLPLVSREGGSQAVAGIGHDLADGLPSAIEEGVFAATLAPGMSFTYTLSLIHI